MPDILSSHIYYNGPTTFTAEQVRAQPDLFAHRAALFYTPTDNLPAEWIGSGRLDVTLPLPTPDYLEFQEVRAYAIPRFWVDLLQRATGRIRWSPVRPARVRITRYGRARLRDDHLAIGAKAARDALKASSSGRADARDLWYFGAIWDDDARSAAFEDHQEIVSTTQEERVRIEVEGHESGSAAAG